VRALKAQLEAALAQHGSARVSVFASGFEQVEHLFAAAAGEPVLASVRWYGSDGAAQHEGIVANPRAAEFAASIVYPSPVFALDEGARDIWQPLHARIRARTEHEPSAFAYAVYDAVWTVARAYIASGATDDPEKLRKAFTTAAASGYGATGWTVLNDAGDRRYGDFDFWAVVKTDGQPRWERVARYESRTGRVTR
jgi:branched-chain amino acid transport system substrate-binding protein